MAEPIFEMMHGHPVPIYPYDDKKMPVFADGQTTFGLQDMAVRTGIQAEMLQAMYDRAFRAIASVDAKSEQAPAEFDDGPLPEKLALLNEIQYPQLDTKQFKVFLAICHERGLSPWEKHLFPEVADERPGGDERKTIRIITGIDAFRSIAQGTQHYDGWKGPFYLSEDGEWRDVLPRKEIPVASRFGVRFKNSNRTRWRIARWESYAPIVTIDKGEAIYPDHWMKMPDIMLSKCAEALALRSAFPRQLGGLYTTDEMEQSRRRRGGYRPVESVDPTDIIPEDQLPQTRMQLELKMIYDMGMKDQSRRNLLIESFNLKYPGMYEQNEAGFCGKVYKELLRKPTLYGMTPNIQQ